MAAQKINTTTHPTTTFWMLADEFGQMYGERPSASPTPPDIDEAHTAGAKPGACSGSQPKTDEQLLQELYLDFHQQPAYPRTALCLSGGGIRSAAFALGVMQFLAKAGLLHRFEYLSTVSGGGYIGSWLSAWFTRAADAAGKGGYAKIGPLLAYREMPEREPVQIENLRANSNYLTPKLGALSADTWSGVAIWLRNLLINWFLLIPLIAAAAVIPQIVSALTGAAEGADWATRIQAIGIFCYFFSLVVFNGARPRWRAFSLNQIKFLIFSWFPLLISAAMWAISMAHPATGLTAIWRWFIPAEIGPFAAPIPDYVFLAIVLYAVAVLIGAIWNARGAEPYVHISKGVPGEQSLEYSFTRTRRTDYPAGVEVYTEDHQAVAGRHYVSNSQKIFFAPNESKAIGTLKVQLTGQKIDGAQVEDGDFFVKFRNPSGVRIGALFPSEAIGDALVFIFSGACFGLFIGAGDLLLRNWFSADGQMSVGHHLLFTTIAVPWLLLSHALAAVIFVAFTSWLPRSDEEREWIGRAAGWILVVACLWLLVAALVLLAPYVASLLLAHFNITPQTIDPKALSAGVATGISALGTASGLLTAIVGGGPKTAAIPGQPQTLWRKIALYIGAPLFLATLFVGLALAIDWLAFGQIFAREIAQPPAGATTNAAAEIRTRVPGDFLGIAVELIKYGVIPALASVLIGYFININRFSLHEMYRNRLVRAFLGASNISQAQRDRFTFFNFTDNLPVSRLWVRSQEKQAPTTPGAKPATSKADWRPFHVLNIALNLVATDKLAWQERKAESFTVSPLWCGSAQLNAFRRASEYGGKNDTLTLGTAMAISGAAVSPNMGYNSSPLITFLLTLFNVRLGWWLGNPKYGRFADEGPRWAAVPLLFELFGLTNDKRNYIYLSDGGHFENLGLYEMVRRRSHLIIVSDAGQDKELAFADLANAVRKIWIDLGIRIEFPKLDDLRVRNQDRDDPKKGGPCYTVGFIRYTEADRPTDGSPNRAKDGIILYLKPGFRGDESADIVGYAATSTDFPHETTVDQWFSESQFESYRGLGFSIMRRAHDEAVKNHNNKVGNREIRDFSGASILSFFESLSMVETTAKPVLPAQAVTPA
ncbi:MAG: patatin-like phospholipase family protein [Methylobacteriaceae bacterium]|nr:patatin-like phospholipase family protein [Methylobacteriaceae bacterium]